jgi:hypothetical protein
LRGLLKKHWEVKFALEYNCSIASLLDLEKNPRFLAMAVSSN